LQEKFNELENSFRNLLLVADDVRIFPFQFVSFINICILCYWTFQGFGSVSPAVSERPVESNESAAHRPGHSHNHELEPSIKKMSNLKKKNSII
jgi:hypothetical protein